MMDSSRQCVYVCVRERLSQAWLGLRSRSNCSEKSQPPARTQAALAVEQHFPRCWEDGPLQVAQGTTLSQGRTGGPGVLNRRVFHSKPRSKG